VKPNQKIVKDQNGDAAFHCFGNAKAFNFETNIKTKKSAS